MGLLSIRHTLSFLLLTLGIVLSTIVFNLMICSRYYVMQQILNYKSKGTTIDLLLPPERVFIIPNDWYTTPSVSQYNSFWYSMEILKTNLTGYTEQLLESVAWHKIYSLKLCITYVVYWSEVKYTISSAVI